MTMKIVKHLTPKILLLVVIDKKLREPQDSQKIENFYEAASQFANFCEAVKTCKNIFWSSLIREIHNQKL